MTKKNIDTKEKKTTTKVKKTSLKEDAKKVKKTPVKEGKDDLVKKVESIQEELDKMKNAKAEAIKEVQLFQTRFNAMLVVIAILMVVIIGIICYNFIDL